MYPADTPFWVGYGAAAEPESDGTLDEAETRFELDVDGVPTTMVTDVQSEAGVPVRKTDSQRVPDRTACGLGGFAGRWYDGGRLILEPSRDPVRRALSAS